MTVDLNEPFDVVIAGGGNAALCAAITAARGGARVIVLEAAPAFYRGGNTRHTRNLRCAHDGSAPTMTGPYAQEEFLDDLMRVTGGQTDDRLAKMTVARSTELIGWLADQGVKFQPPLGGTLSLGKTNAFFLGGGRGELNALYRQAEALGVNVIYDAPVTALMITGGFFVSAQVTYEGRQHSVRGKAFIAACGGFEANIEWLKQYWGAAADNFLIRGTPYNRGDVLRMLLDAGMMPVADPTQCHAVAIDARAPRYDGGIATRLDSVVFGIMVNREAKRFYDEGEDAWPKRYAIWGRLIAQQPGQIAYSIIDSRSIHMFMPSIFPAVEAQTIAELASKLELDPAALEKTVAKFNAAVKPGTFDHTILDDCRTEGLTIRKSHWARTHRRAAVLRLSAAPRHHLHLSRRARERQRAHADERWHAHRQHVRRRRDHGRQRLGQGLSRRYRHDHRHGVRPHRRGGSGGACQQLKPCTKPTG